MQYYDNNSGSLKQKQHMKEYLFSIKVNSEYDNRDNHDNHDNDENDIENNVNSDKKKSGFIEKQIVNRFKNLFYYYTN